MSMALLLYLLAAFLSTQSSAPFTDSKGHYLLIQAFNQFVSYASLATTSEPTVAEIGCGDETCLLFSCPENERDAVLKALPQLLAGFGFGASVEEIEFRTFPASHKAASLSVVVRPKDRAMATNEITSKVEDLMAFLRVVSQLSERHSGAFHPVLIAADRPIYFLLTLSVEQGGEQIRGELAAPPHSPLPGEAPGHRIGNEISFPRCCSLDIESAGTVSEGLFKGWRKHSLRWKRVCGDQLETLH